MFKRLLGVLVALSLIFTACGGDSDSDSSDDTPAAPATSAPEPEAEADEPAPAPEPDDEEPAPEPEADEPAPAPEPDDEEPAPEPEPEATPVPLTASFRGVTETEIRIGMTSLDAEMFGFDQGDLASKWQVAVDAVNAKPAESTAGCSFPSLMSSTSSEQWRPTPPA